MRKLYILFTITLSFSLTAQTSFDFQGSEDALGFTALGGISAANLSFGADGMTVSWDGPTTDADGAWPNGRKPQLRHITANIDADNQPILALTITNNSNGATDRFRLLHYRGNLSGDDEPNVNGFNGQNDLRYIAWDIPGSMDSQETFYFNVANATWTNYTHSSETDDLANGVVDFDHIRLQFLKKTGTSGAALNDWVSTPGSVIIHKIEFLEEVPSQERHDFTFDTAGDTEGFIGQNSVSVAQTGAGELQLNIGQNSYPKLTQSGIYSVNADSYKYCRVYMSENNSPKTRMSLVSPNGGNQFVGVDLIPYSTDAQVLDFDLSTTDNFTNWNGSINNFAFQITEPSEEGAPLQVGGTVSIDRILFSTENPLSVDLLDLENSFELYPNPVKETLYVKTPLQINKMSVVNMLGQEVMRQFGNNNALKVSNLSPGLYVLKTLHENGLDTTRKFIIE